ncbi:YpmA family protein [Evansella sp. AB-P1]|uniref:YpmA family protein n=1 Tax=Evansella sp. AB-P1 TaxID=3037653 RepID=UPI00241E3CC7|nr:YpmA family protein [Evansella sp. AB-P1]MDG5787558.1 YpmA family protein [Evansella sp. AB-P1]
MGKKEIEALASIKIDNNPELYRLVNTLNSTLKERDLTFGLALDKESNSKMVFTIYET